jgi:CRISPR/Cas system-associated exonuclease Cas4 (RecB family)
MEYAPFTYIGGERVINMPYTIDCNGTKLTVALGGKIDRVDIKDSTINIIDYKTGRNKRETKTSLENIFENKISSAAYRMQAFLYSIILDELLKGNHTVGDKDFAWIEEIRRKEARKISPSLLYIHDTENSSREKFVVDVLNEPIKDICTIKEEYMTRLKSVLEEIFDINKPFMPASNEKNCENCDYRKICGK